MGRSLATRSLVVALACTPKAAPVEGSPDPALEPATPARSTAASPEPADGLRPEERAEADLFMAAYRRGDVSRQTAYANAVLVATSEDPCVEMPETRPADFELQMSRVDHDEGLNAFWGVAERECHFAWDPFHLEPPPLSCVLASPEALDAAWAGLRKLEAWKIRSREVPETVHRSGVGLVIRWPGARCRIRDIHGSAVVVDADAEAWDGVLAVFYGLVQE